MKKYIGWTILCLVFLLVLASICYTIGFIEAIIFVTSIIIASVIILAINLIS